MSRIGLGKLSRTYAVVLFMLLALASRTVSAQTALNDSGSDLPSITPEKIISFDADVRIDGIYPSADGLQLYARLKEPTLNIWSILVYYTPEYMLVLLGMILVMCFYRLFRGRNVVGYHHCRKCRYLLVNHSGKNCPECGAGLDGRNRAFGRPVMRRILLVGLILLLGGGAYYLGRDRRVFQGSLSRFFHWDSRSLYKADLVGKYFDIWYDYHHSSRDRIVRIDLLTGDIEPIHSMDDGDVRWLLDHKGLVLTVLHADRIEQFDVETGTLIRQVKPKGEGLIALIPGISRQIIAGEESHVLYLTLGKGIVSRWDLKQKTFETIWKREPDDSTRTVSIRYLDQRKQVFIMPWGNQQAFNWQLWDVQSGLLQTRRDQPGLWPFTGYLPSHDEVIVYTGNLASHEIEGFNLNSGEQVMKTEAAVASVIPLAIVGEGQFLLTAVRRGMNAFLYDLQHDAWVAQLGGLRVSPGTAIDLVGKDKFVIYGSVLASPRAKKDLVVYDLSSLLTDN